MGNTTLDTVKKAVKREFSRKKKTDPDLKLGHVYDQVSRRAGFKDWNVYSAHLKTVKEL